MKKTKITLGIDLGVSSCGLAIVEEKEGKKEIKKLAVRVVPEDPNFHGKYYSGLRASKHQERTEKRGSRRNNQRFKQRRDKLIKVLKKNEMYPDNKLIHLDAYKLYELRAKAVTKKISLEELGRVLLLLNQRRGFLSNRKSNTSDENSTDYKQRIKFLEENLQGNTIGQGLFNELKKEQNVQQVLLRERTYFRHLYLEEFDRIWDKQAAFYTKTLTGNSQTSENKNTLYDEIRNKIIFYQRPLKSQKSLVSSCELETNFIKLQLNKEKSLKELRFLSRKNASITLYSHEYSKIKLNSDVITTFFKKYSNEDVITKKDLLNTLALDEHKDYYIKISHKATVKSSPYFEVFRIWQRLNDLSWKDYDGVEHKPAQEQKQALFNALFYNQSNVKNYKGVNSKYKLTISEIKKVLGYGIRDKIYFNYSELEASRTYKLIKDTLEKAGVNESKQYLSFDLKKNDEKGGLLELWHITYSLATNKEISNALQKRFNFTKVQSDFIAEHVNYTSDYGSLSTKAIRKLLPFMQQGLNFYEAKVEAKYISEEKTITEKIVHKKLKPIVKNSLRNPVVEQILNQMVNMVNQAIETYDLLNKDKYEDFEIRVELARELRNSAKTRSKITSANKNNKKDNNKIRAILQNEYQFKIVNGRDVKRYKLWEQTNKECLYCGKNITCKEFMEGTAEMEHILPKSRSFNNNMSNYILAHKACNSGSKGKNQMTAYDFMESKGEEELHRFVTTVNMLYDNGSNKAKISKAKFENLLTRGEDIPDDFVDRMKKDSQYISKEAVKHLKTICLNTNTTTGQVTDFLRDKWGLKEVLQDVNFDKYEQLGQVETKTIKRKGGEKEIKVITDWSKRDDHRHHAIDALICALTDQKIIYKLNNLNKLYQYNRDALSTKEVAEIEAYLSEELAGNTFNLKSFSDLTKHYFSKPIPNLRKEVGSHLESILISFKKDNNKVLTKSKNKIKNAKVQETWVPRKRLHEDTILGVKNLGRVIPVSKIYNCELIVDETIKKEAYKRLSLFDNDYYLAFSKKSLKEIPFKIKDIKLEEVEVKTLTKRVLLNDSFTSAQLEKIIDPRIKSIVKNRVEENDGKIKGAFKDVLYSNEKKKIQIKKVLITEESKVEKIRKGYAKPGGNHHALIFINNKGEYTNKVISFYDAVQIGLLNIRETGKPTPIIKRKDNDFYGQFVFSMQINDLFVFDLKHTTNPQEENELNFLDEKNRAFISEKLFRLQKMTKKSDGRFEVTYRHHLETSIERKTKDGKKADMKKLKGMVWREEASSKHLGNITKIKINHLGDIIKIGE